MKMHSRFFKVHAARLRDISRISKGFPEILGNIIPRSIAGTREGWKSRMEIFKKIFCIPRKEDERESSPGESIRAAREGERGTKRTIAKITGDVKSLRDDSFRRMLRPKQSIIISTTRAFPRGCDRDNFYASNFT